MNIRADELVQQAVEVGLVSPEGLTDQHYIHSVAVQLRSFRSHRMNN